MRVYELIQKLAEYDADEEVYIDLYDEDAREVEGDLIEVSLVRSGYTRRLSIGVDVPVTFKFDDPFAP